MLYFGLSVALMLLIHSVSTRVRQPPKVSSNQQGHVTKRSHAMSNDGVRQSSAPKTDRLLEIDGESVWVRDWKTEWRNAHY